MRQLQRVLSLVYPDQCVLCDTRVEQQGGLCGDCWKSTPFLTGLVCHGCGMSLPGTENDHVYCDECLSMPRPWSAGRAALEYKDAGRRIVQYSSDDLDLVNRARGLSEVPLGTVFEILSAEHKTSVHGRLHVLHGRQMQEPNQDVP